MLWTTPIGYHFGIKPWEMANLSLSHYVEIMRACDQLAKDS